MDKPYFYRYFLGFRPSHHHYGLLTRVGREAGQSVSAGRLHLTLCVIAECRERDHFLLPRVRAALDQRELSSFPIHLGRIRGGPGGAAIYALGDQDHVQDFYRALTHMLRSRDIAPLHRKAGLKAHITLGYAPCRFEPFKHPLEWFPRELLLIESEVGRTIHNVLARWRLLPPPQGSLPFELPVPQIRVAL